MNTPIMNFDDFSESFSGDKIEKLNSLSKKQMLNKELYDLGWSRERRIDGFIMDRNSSRKIRFKDIDDGKDFYIEIVNKSDESFVAEIGGCVSKSIHELVDLVKEY